MENIETIKESEFLDFYNSRTYNANCFNDDGSLNKNGLMSVDDEKSDQYLLEKNDIVFARTGASTGRNYFYDGEINNMAYKF